RSGLRWGSLLGTLEFDPADLRYAGQPLTSPMVLVNDQREADGQLRVLSLSLPALDRVTADLRFVVRRSGYAARLRYRMAEAVTPDLKVVSQRSEDRPLVAGLGAVDSATPVGRPGLAEWQKILGIVEPPRRMVAGGGRVFGDVTLNGVVDALDALFIAN